LQLKEVGVRAEADLSAERMNAKIRNAQLMKVPYMLVVGDAEQANHTLALRKRDGTRINDMSVGGFMEMVRQKIGTRAAEL
jgi:threonyl-tRNA synthetase